MSISVKMIPDSEEWLEFRKKKIGASDSPIIMGVSPWKKPFDLWEEKLGLKESYMNVSMKRGKDLEEEARLSFERDNDLFVLPVVLMHSKYDWMIASIDGMDLDKKYICELKCPGKKDHDIAISGSIPDKYYPQLQHQLAVTGLEFSYYYSYRDGKGVTLKIYRNDDYIDDMIKKEQEFYECLVNITPPKE